MPRSPAVAGVPPMHARPHWRARRPRTALRGCPPPALLATARNGCSGPSRMPRSSGTSGWRSLTADS
eukprot:6908549-Pyramimonas_sp.AAC.1